MNPTPEQIESAKQWAKLGPAGITDAQYAQLSAYDRSFGTWRNARHILLAALEAAEPLAEIGRLAVERYRANIAKTDTVDDWRRADVEMSMMCGAYLANTPKP